MVKRHHCRYALWNRPCGQNTDVSVSQIFSLLRRHNYILIIRQNKHRLCRRGMYGLQYIVCGGIHCLTASYNAVGSKILKHGFYSASSRDSHKTVVLFRLCRLEMLSFSYFFVLYSCFMLDPHIFYLRLGIVNDVILFYQTVGLFGGKALWQETNIPKKP